MNSPKKEPLLPVANSGPRPGDFDIGSPKSKAAARRLIENRKKSTSYTHIHGLGECEHCQRNEHGPNDMTICINNASIVNEESASPREKARPEPEPVLPVPQQEQIAADAPPPRPESGVGQHSDDYLVHEERMPEPEPRRRPIARKPPYRRWAWWPPSAYGL